MKTINDTIVQLSTPRVVSAIHIIRLSGSESKTFFFRHTSLEKPQPCRVYTTPLYSDSDGKKEIDHILGFYFTAPHSFTGEDVVELHVHGSLLIVDEILKLAVSEGCRLANPGEFTYRAFLNGKLHLHQAEAVDALIHSESGPQKQNALRILTGRAGFNFKDLAGRITSMLAELESAIEYPEEDIPLVTTDKKTLYVNYLKQLDEIRQYFQRVLSNYQVGKKLAEGFKVMIVGSPNSGKSTLFNLLLGEDRAIVSPIQGTTRDYIVEKLVMPMEVRENSIHEINAVGNKLELQLYDTAGIHDYPEEIEAEGINKVKSLVPEMDLLLWLVADEESYVKFRSSAVGQAMLSSISDNLWVLINKSDALNATEKEALISRVNKDYAHENEQVIKAVVSMNGDAEQNRQTKTEMYVLLREWIVKTFRYDRESVALLNKRQALVTGSILKALENIRTRLTLGEHEEIIVNEFRALEYHFKELSLDTGLEEVYDTLFSKFCIGK